MAKRHAALDAAPPAKRRERGRRAAPTAPILLMLSDECLLLVLSHLDAQDLARAQQVCTRLADLARHGRLWRHCLLRDFLTQRIDAPKLPIAPLEPLLARTNTARALARLPARYHRMARGDFVQPDWQRLYVLWHNWHSGRIRVAALTHDTTWPSPPPHAPATGTAPASIPTSLPGPDASDATADTLVQASINLVFTARRTHDVRCVPTDAASVAAALPPLSVYLADTPHASQRRLPLAVVQPAALAERIAAEAHKDAALASHLAAHGLVLTEMRVDDAAEEAWSVRLCLCLAPGILAVLRIAVGATLALHAEHVWFEHGPVRLRPVRQAALCGPTLVTCTDDFRLHIWRVASTPTLVRALRSTSTRWPACLTLRRVDFALDRITIASVAPVRGDSARVVLQTFDVHDAHGATSVTSRVAHAQAPCVAGGAVTSVIYDAPYLVLGTAANVLDVYRVTEPSAAAAGACVGRAASATPPGAPLRIVHCRTLYGHTSRISSVALRNGRCVSGASDGSVRVWSMGAAPGEHVATLHGHVPDADDRGTLRALLPHAPRRGVPTLAELARELPHMPAATPGVIRHVSTAFDTILCVTAGCRAAARAEEQVQVWHFAS
ncbi:hypothetical protein MBRA1_000244 [Malassezia brasiliensis]|uniref:F-box domain-containing protein n=1 Tax=Malassezia brasiliensis TaxID=1821822 RepID=A0AAF0DQJ5_9BASI|nr:hypothetical protein MBRA1_000244 [Malassezia brasiliensis]